MTKIKFGNREYQTPRSRPLRIGAGILLILFGIVGFLPVVGFWMIPLGILVLSFDVPPIRRARRRFDVWYGRWSQKRRNRAKTKDSAEGSDPNI